MALLKHHSSHCPTAHELLWVCPWPRGGTTEQAAMPIPRPMLSLQTSFQGRCSFQMLLPPNLGCWRSSDTRSFREKGEVLHVLGKTWTSVFSGEFRLLDPNISENFQISLFLWGYHTSKFWEKSCSLLYLIPWDSYGMGTKWQPETAYYRTSPRHCFATETWRPWRGPVYSDVMNQTEINNM